MGGLFALAIDRRRPYGHIFIFNLHVFTLKYYFSLPRMMLSLIAVVLVLLNFAKTPSCNH